MPSATCIAHLLLNVVNPLAPVAIASGGSSRRSCPAAAQWQSTSRQPGRRIADSTATVECVSRSYILWQVVRELSLPRCLTWSTEIQIVLVSSGVQKRAWPTDLAVISGTASLGPPLPGGAGRYECPPTGPDGLLSGGEDFAAALQRSVCSDAHGGAQQLASACAAAALHDTTPATYQHSKSVLMQAWMRQRSYWRCAWGRAVFMMLAC